MCLQSISSRYALAHSRYEFTNAQWMGWICAACGLRLQSCGCVYRIVTKLGMDLQFPQIIDTGVVECLQLICCPIDIFASVTITTSSVRRSSRLGHGDVTGELTRGSSRQDCAAITAQAGGNCMRKICRNFPLQFAPVCALM